MAAEKGNKYNEVWDIETAEQFCDDVLAYIQDNPKCRSLSEACTELGQYEDLLNYLNKKFDKDFLSIKRSKDIVKNRLVNQGLDGEANATMAIFILKNNHNFTDKQQTDVTTNGKDVNNSPSIVFMDLEDED